jgi:hypothetical protein
MFTLVAYYTMLFLESIPVFLFSTKKHYISEYYPIFIYCFFSFTFELVSFLTLKLNVGGTVFVFNLYGIFEFTSILLFFYKFFPKFRIAYHLLIPLFIVTYVYNFIKSNELESSTILFSIIYVVFSIICLFEHLKSAKSNQLIERFLFAILVYNTGSIVLFYILPFLDKSEIWIWGFHNLLYSISLLILIYSIWKLPTNDFFKTEPPKV